MNIHIAVLSLERTNSLGLRIDKQTASIRDIMSSQQEMLVVQDSENSNTKDYPSLRQYLELEALSGYKLKRLFNNMVITINDQAPIDPQIACSTDSLIAPKLFSPTDISGLFLWWSADYGYSSDSTTAYWQEKNNVYTASSTLGNRPTYISGGSAGNINGYPVINFAQDFLEIGAAGPFLNNKDGATIVSVYRYKSTSDSSGALLDVVNRANLGHYLSGSNRVARFSYRRLDADVLSTIDGPTYVNDTVYKAVSLVDFRSGNEKAYLDINDVKYNGTAPSTGAFSNTNTYIGIGFKDRNILRNMDCDVAEILVYDRALTDAEVTSLKTYLNKYGV